MDEPEFRRMVAEYEHTSRHEPRRFAMVTAALAALGYAFILGLLALAAVALVWGVERLLQGRFSLGLVLLVAGSASLLWSLARALWSRQVPPEGVVVTHREAPRLFELVEQVRRKCGAPRPDVILLDGDLNAAIVQQPRLGLLGWHRNYLILGLPMMMALDARQLSAVIAHEFGHLRGAHGKLGAWVYRTRRSWWLLAASRERARVAAWWADAALALFFKHFFPRFNARAFVLSRQQEYEADALSHEVAGPQASAESLISTDIQARYLSDCLWPDVYAAAATSATPNVQPYLLMHKRLREALKHPDASAWLRDALKRLPDVADTHPSLRDRLEFAHAKPQVPAPAEASAAETLLREAYPAWLKRFDKRWKKEVAEHWGHLHRHQLAQRALVAELAAERAQGTQLSADDHLMWARAARQTEGPLAEAKVLRQMLADHPKHAEARFELGITLIDGKEAQAEGAELLRGLGEAGGHAFAAPAARRYERWLEASEKFAELKPWRERLRLLEQQAEDAWDAVHGFEGRLHFESPEFGKRVLRPLLDRLRREPAVGRAFLVKKVAPAAPGWRFYVLIIERSRALGQPSADHWWEYWRDNAELPCACMAIDLAHPTWKDSSNAGLVRQMIETPGACIYTGRKL